MTWPRLSETLPRQEYARCNQCGGEAAETWQECDEHDQQELIYIRLCHRCAEEIIEPHPRLYRECDLWEPAPGAMHCCGGCLHHKNLTCLSPLRKDHGGPGLAISISVDSRGFACTRGKGCMPFTHYNAPPVCRGREEAANEKQTR